MQPRKALLVVTAALFGCGAAEERPMTPAGKERIVRDFQEAQALHGNPQSAPAGPASLCASSTKGVRAISRSEGGRGPDGFGTAMCPAATQE